MVYLYHNLFVVLAGGYHGSDPAFHFDVDPDHAFHSDADPDPTFQFGADPDPAPITHVPVDLDPPMLQNDHLRLPFFHFDAVHCRT
jgi:hypothetical protein